MLVLPHFKDTGLLFNLDLIRVWWGAVWLMLSCHLSISWEDSTVLEIESDTGAVSGTQGASQGA